MKWLNNILQKIRHVLFWYIDVFRGSKIKSHLAEIKGIIEHSEQEKSEVIKARYLLELLEHAVTSTPFYKHIDYKRGISTFPVINKNTINNNYNDFKSQHYINTYSRTAATSGSTGTPLEIIQNKNKIDRNTADTIYFSELAGFKIGNKLFFLRHWNTSYKKSKFKNWLQNVVPIEVVTMNAEKIEEWIAVLKKDRSQKAFLGFPSGFEYLCKYLDRTKAKPIKSNVKSIIGMAEGLNAYTKERMAYYFKTPMVSRYSNMENGILAQQTPKSGNEFIINWASYYIEVLNIDNDQPAPTGAVGRIVVTDLFNYAMPLIRYDTGDLGLMNDECTPPTLLRIEGRTTDTIYNTKGEIVSSFIMTNIINFKGIKQIQLIQENTTEYQIKLNISDNFDSEENLLSSFKKILGMDAEIKVKYVNKIPLLDSGKRKMTLNKMKK